MDLAGASVPGANEIRAQALEVAGGWSPPGAPRSWRLTAALFEAIAAHDELLERLAVLPPDRLPALLASAAVTFMVRRDRPVPLAGYFPDPAAPQPRFDDGFFPAFNAFCTARLDDIVDVCHRHRYQMNEVARCTQIALGIVAASAGSAGPVALVDLGTGAGLGLQLDRYRYQIGTGTAVRKHFDVDAGFIHRLQPLLPQIGEQSQRIGHVRPWRAWLVAAPRLGFLVDAPRHCGN